MGQRAELSFLDVKVINLAYCTSEQEVTDTESKQVHSIYCFIGSADLYGNASMHGVHVLVNGSGVADA